VGDIVGRFLLPSSLLFLFLTFFFFPLFPSPFSYSVEARSVGGERSSKGGALGPSSGRVAFLSLSLPPPFFSVPFFFFYPLSSFPRSSGVHDRMRMLRAALETDTARGLPFLSPLFPLPLALPFPSSLRPRRSKRRIELVKEKTPNPFSLLPLFLQGGSFFFSFPLFFCRGRRGGR